MSSITGPGAAQHQLAIEYQGKKGEEQPGASDDSISESTEGMEFDNDENSEISDNDQSQVRKTSTPKRRKRGKKRFKEPGLDSSGSLSPVGGGGTDQKESKDKKLKYDGDGKLSGKGISVNKWTGVKQQQELGNQQLGAHQQGTKQLGAQQLGVQQPGVQQLGEGQLGEQNQADLLEEQQQANCETGLENSSEVTVGEVLPAAPPGSTEPGGGGGGV